VDLVKTRVQACGKGTTAIAVVRDVWRVSGIRGFYRGFSPCLLRAGPANAIKFLGVEATLQVLGYSPF
jgi:solute carrier family 25 carnitine/acylcarnitine transporter 20/29